MNNFEYKNLRGKIFKRLKSESDPEKRQDILREEKSKPEFGEAEKSLREERKNSLKNSRERSYSDGNSLKAIYVGFLTSPYVDLSINPNYLDGTRYDQVEKKKIIETFNLLKEKLQGSTLIDLGSSDPGSFENLYKFATVFEVKKLIGVEKYPDDTKDYWQRVMDYLTTEGEFYKKLQEKDEGHKLPQFEINLNTDMLDFLEKRTAQSNFIMSGIDEYILKKEDYIERLCENFSRLTPKGGIVIGNSSVINERKDLMKKNGFIGTDIDVFHTFSQMYIWEKV